MRGGTLPRTSTVVWLRCPLPDCHGMLRDLKVGHAVNGAYTRRCRVCWVYCRVAPRLLGSSAGWGWPIAVDEPRRIRSDAQKNCFLPSRSEASGATCVAPLESKQEAARSSEGICPRQRPPVADSSRSEPAESSTPPPASLRSTWEQP